VPSLSHSHLLSNIGHNAGQWWHRQCCESKHSSSNSYHCLTLPKKLPGQMKTKFASLSFLLTYKSEAGDGGNFKIATWCKAATHVNKTLTKGALKMANSCKGKYQQVSTAFFRHLKLILMSQFFLWFRTTHEAVCAVHSNSGCPGMSILVPRRRGHGMTTLQSTLSASISS
jgi:hypothetical protein